MYSEVISVSSKWGQLEIYYMCVCYLLFGVSSGTSHMDNGSTRAVCFVTRFACRSCDSYPVAVASYLARGGGGYVKRGWRTRHETRGVLIVARSSCCACVVVVVVVVFACLGQKFVAIAGNGKGSRADKMDDALESCENCCFCCLSAFLFLSLINYTCLF